MLPKPIFSELTLQSFHYSTTYDFMDKLKTWVGYIDLRKIITIPRSKWNHGVGINMNPVGIQGLTGFDCCPSVSCATIARVQPSWAIHFGCPKWRDENPEKCFELLKKNSQVAIELIASSKIFSSPHQKTHHFLDYGLENPVIYDTLQLIYMGEDIPALKPTDIIHLNLDHFELFIEYHQRFARQLRDMEFQTCDSIVIEMNENNPKTVMETVDRMLEVYDF